MKKTHPHIGKRVKGINNRLFEEDEGTLIKHEGMRVLIRRDLGKEEWYGTYSITIE